LHDRSLQVKFGGCFLEGIIILVFLITMAFIGFLAGLCVSMQISEDHIKDVFKQGYLTGSKDREEN
jgi:hypothetical protein